MDNATSFETQIIKEITIYIIKNRLSHLVPVFTLSISLPPPFPPFLRPPVPSSLPPVLASLPSSLPFP